jgi:histidinol-phosphate aminotransferase
MIRKDIMALSGYHVPSSTGMIKLDAMENPFPMPKELRSAWARRLAQVDINRYPDADMLSVREKIAARNGLNADQVLLGNGSDEIIQMLLMATCPGTCVVPTPSFVMYDLISHWLKRPVASVPLGRDFSLDVDRLIQVCRREKAEITFLACPNNPTGNLWPEQTIAEITKRMHGALILDEAYAPFADHTHTHLIAPNVMVLRTYSKLGWAGLRLGYLLGDAKNIAQLNKVRMPYNINALTQASAEFLLDHFETFEQQAKAICNERERVMKALAALDGITAYPSQANFLLVRTPDSDAVSERLLSRNILVKNLNGSNELLRNCLRITIGSKEENDAALAALGEILKEIPT